MKRTLILSLVAVACIATTTFGQSAMWFDVRDNTNTAAAGGAQGQFIAGTTPGGGLQQPYTNGQDVAGGGGNSADRFGTAAINGGARGAGAVLRLNPVQAGGNHAILNPNGAGSGFPNYPVAPAAADNNAATGALYVYMDVADDVSGTGDVISSIGVDTLITPGPLNTVARSSVAGTAMTVYNDGTVAAQAGGSPAVPWNASPVNGVGTAAGVTGTKMVRVPVAAGPVYDVTLGIQPNANPYRIARMDVVAGTRNCTGRTANAHVDNSTWTVKLSVNNLLCTRVFASGGDAVEDCSWGYDPYVADAAFGTLDVAINGSTSGATSANPDAAIQMRLRGDFNGDGNVTAIDQTGLNAAIGASVTSSAKVRQMYLGDFNNNRTITAIDQAGFNKAIAASIVCP